MDGKQGIVDGSKVRTATEASSYARLADPVFIGGVQLELGVPSWPNGADLDPAWRYDSIAEGETWSNPLNSEAGAIHL
jgi:hypothetical protein